MTALHRAFEQPIELADTGGQPSQQLRRPLYRPDVGPLLQCPRRWWPPCPGHARCSRRSLLAAPRHADVSDQWEQLSRLSVPVVRPRPPGVDRRVCSTPRSLEELLVRLPDLTTEELDDPNLSSPAHTGNPDHPDHP